MSWCWNDCQQNDFTEESDSSCTFNFVCVLGYGGVGFFGFLFGWLDLLCGVLGCVFFFVVNCCLEAN